NGTNAWLAPAASPPLFAIRHSLFALSHHSPANQRFHVPDVLAADFVGDRSDAGGARHRVPPEKKVVAGADQAGVEQHRIDLAELAAFDAFREQAAVKVEQRRDKEFRDLVGGLRGALV